MSRIFVTGDTHQSIDLSKLDVNNFPEQKNLTKDDYVIVCGDFGMVWRNSETEMLYRKWLEERNFTTLWVDGNHENFDLLEKFPVSIWNGGKVHYISDSIIHLMRGQVFNINGLKFFTMGGATSIDKDLRVPGLTWWSQEIPSKEEFDEALVNLDKHNWEVDYVITHTTSNRIMKELGYIKEDTVLNKFFDMLEEKLKFKHWYFGHFHDDVELDKHTLLYNKIIEITL